MKIVNRKVLIGCSIVLSFVLLESQASAQMAAIAAINEPESAAEARGSASETAGRQATQKNSAKSGGRVQNASTSGKKVKSPTSIKTKPPSAFIGAILGDKYTFLNFEVASAEKPYYTRAAKASGAKGLVQVEVLVSTDGSVLSANARTGSKELWPEAERAALASKFNRPTANGRPARAMGFLVYRFGPAED
ncbi:hypothetical protein BH10ACI2_BH10ACI2_22790 [soil metagenome]